MSTNYYDDPIEDYDIEGDYHYAHQHNTYQNTNLAGGQHFYDDDLDLDYDLSSPSPSRAFIQSYDQQRDYHDNSQHLSAQYPITSYNPPRRTVPRESNPVMSTSYNAFNQSQSQSNVRQPSQSSNPNTAHNVGYQAGHNSQPLRNGDQASQSTPRNMHGVRLRPVSELPDKFRSLFKFGVFNAVQSSCLDEVLHADTNLVISAPTGSGKTVLFELAMIRTLEKSQRINKPSKCIYIAPTKALCTEKFQDWVAKFEPLGFKCCELTGDTVVFGKSAWGEAKHASIIVTTCEKWDSLTRSWHDHEWIFSQIELFLVDEVHILNESRGSVLEVVTSRMKLRGPNVRFVLVSATVPNIQDVASWIGSGFGKSDSAKIFEFGDDYRPCKLTRHVVGVPKKQGQNDFQFNKVLDFRLYAVIKEFSVGKPILVFVSTRKGVFGAAEQLMKEYGENEGKKVSLPWSRPPRIDNSFNDKRLNDLAAVGIGVHHAGLSFEDRRKTEQLFLNKQLRVLVATSTLAVGVNLPAHMVVIKGVQTFANNASREYSDLDIMQMLGRAGRPQFDKDGIAVILCEAHLEKKYKALVQGNTILESSLHLNLAEHINSEIGLGTITDVNSAKTWLQSSFLYQRMQRNPQYYTITKSDGVLAAQDDASLVLQSIEQLKATQLVEHDITGANAGKLTATQYGDIMSKYYIRRATMELILALPEHASLREILETICAAEEFQDCKLRASEKTLYNKLRKDIEIRFEVKKVDKTCDKIFLLVQAVLGGISFSNPDYKSSDSQPNMEAFAVFKHISRVAKAALDIAVVKKNGAQVKHGLELCRCLSAKAWEDRAIVLRQIEHLGEKSIKVLAEHGVTSFAQLRKQNPLRIETLLNRRSPFGLDVISFANELPQYNLQIKELEVVSNGGKSPVEVRLGVECTLIEGVASKSKSRKFRNRSYDKTAVLTLTSDMDFVDFRRIPSKALAGGKSFELSIELKKPSQSVVILITSENVAGVAVQQFYKPNVSPSEYPVPQTRPLTSIEMDLEGLEDDPDFWNMTLESDSPKAKPLKEVENFESKSATQKASSSVAHQTNEANESRLRDDGRYECNHPCKDKTNCRHLCCREGLSEPPTQSKKKAAIPNGQSHPSSSHSVKDIRSKQSTNHELTQCLLKPKTPSTTGMDKTMEQLNNLHARAQAVNDFRLPKGQQRLTMDGPPTKNKRRLPVEFNMEFTDISDTRGTSTFDFPEAPDDDDLPESIIPSGSQAKSLQQQAEAVRSWSLDVSDQPPGKKNCSPSNGPSRKRPKRQHARSPSPQHCSSPQPLFLPSGSSDSDDAIEVSSPVPVRKCPNQYAWRMTPSPHATDFQSNLAFDSATTHQGTGSESETVPALTGSPVPDYLDEVAQTLADLDNFFKENSAQTF